MRVMAGSTHLERKEQEWREKAQTVLAERDPQPEGLFARIVYWVTFSPLRERRNRKDYARYCERQADNYKQGRLGEDKLEAILGARLDGTYTMFRNYMPPKFAGRGGDIDALLVGPKGVAVFEVKAWSGDLRYTGGEWRYGSSTKHGGTRWRKTPKNPTEQIINNKERVQCVLARANLGEVSVYPVLSMTRGKVKFGRSVKVGVMLLDKRGPDFKWLEILEKSSQPIDTGAVVAALERVSRPD